MGSGSAGRCALTMIRSSWPSRWPRGAKAQRWCWRPRTGGTGPQTCPLTPVLHLAYPLGIKGFAYRRVKNDERDAAGLADLLRMGRLPEAWIAPPEVRGLREAVRHRAKLVAVRSGFKAGVHAVLAKQGLHIAVSDLFGPRGRAELARASLDTSYRARVNAYCRLIDTLDREIELA